MLVPSEFFQNGRIKIKTLHQLVTDNASIYPLSQPKSVLTLKIHVSIIIKDINC